MKKTVTALSLIANLLLVALIAILSVRERARSRIERAPIGGARSPISAQDRTTPAIQRTPIGAAREPGPSVESRSPEGAAGNKAADSGWTDLARGSDYRALIEKAREFGMPIVLVRALADARFAENYAAKKHELPGATASPVPYWKLTSDAGNQLDPKSLSDLRRMSQDFNNVLSDTLGDGESGLGSAVERLQYGNLAKDKIDQLKAIASDYGDMEFNTRQNPIMLASDRAQLEYLEGEKVKDIKAVLTSDEFEEYQLRASSTSNSLRSNLQYFAPTEDEFLRIFAIQQPLNARYKPDTGPLTLEELRQRTLDQQAAAEQIKAALDPSRFADYEKATDPRYRTAMQVVTQLNLPTEAGTTIWQEQKDLQARAAALRSDRTLSPPQQNEKLAALQVEATTTIAAALGGQPGLSAYKRSGGGWMDFLVPVNLAK